MKHETREVLFMMQVRELKGAAFNIGQLAALLPIEGDGRQLTPERRATFMRAVDSVLDLFYPESYEPEPVRSADLISPYTLAEGGALVPLPSDSETNDA